MVVCMCHGGLVGEKRDEERMCATTQTNLGNIILVCVGGEQK